MKSVVIMRIFIVLYRHRLFPSLFRLCSCLLNGLSYVCVSPFGLYFRNKSLFDVHSVG
jgi:hypothetical protein